jgi:hypothetical protein
MSGSPTPTPDTEHEEVVDTAINGYMVFVNNATYIDPTAYEWPQDKINTVKAICEDVIYNGYAGARGFGSVDQWASAFGITKAPSECPDCGYAGGAIRLAYFADNIARGGHSGTPMGDVVPIIKFGDTRTPVAEAKTVYHELAHIWDRTHGETLNADMKDIVGASLYRDYDESKPARTDVANHGNFPTEYAKAAPWEDFAESVTAYFLVDAHFAWYPDWSDDDPRYLDSSGNPVSPDTIWYPPDRMDRYDYIESLFSRTW